MYRIAKERMIRGKNNELNPEALRSLGAERLAEILVERARTSATLRRKLLGELSVLASPDVGAPIRQWIADMQDAKWFLDWAAYQAAAQEFEALREAITTRFARISPGMAPELLWLWFPQAGAIDDRTSEECLQIQRSCERACFDVVRLSVEAGVEPAFLVTQIAAAVAVEHSGEYPACLAHLETVSKRPRGAVNLRG